MSGLFDRKKRAKSAQLTVRLDEQLKKRAELRMEAMGMTATDAVEQLYRYIAEHGRMPLATRVVTTDDPFFRQGEITSFSLRNLNSEDPEDNVLRVPHGAHFAATASASSAGHKDSQADSDATGFARRFVAFLAARGISCSDSSRFTAEVCQYKSVEGIRRTVMRVMTQRGMSHAKFVFHNETLAELPRLAESLPRELMTDFGFTADEAAVVLNQIQPARRPE
ncbi:type II toxin-antitoxin system RelB/DinJ family antitoxin [Erwinia sp. ACCC 02193]|uniref:Type II toxin-antitoxin system RelB/DinJ family antitoxin n=1 Tax=Erwinia aeris TaxID=3239803 RepID=A0ABV4EEM3_9GAMM